jgi:hypothetical protein
VGTVAGTLDHGIRWTLIGPGTISNTGIYVAPSGIAERLTAMVTATSRADPSKSMTAQVAIQPVVAISISPTAGTLTANQKLRFKPEQTGTLNSTVRWSLAGPGNLTADGEYEAPSAIRAEEAARITVTSVADPNKTATAVIVLQPVSVSILPVSTELKASQTAKFYAATPDGNGATVKWSLNGDGSISQEGLYTAPAMIGTDHDVRITATSLADPSRSATASVQLKRYRGALTGVLTWTGAIEKNGTLTIDDAGASRGVLQGAMLPGIPVMIQLDNPQAFRIFKAPGPSNDWKRLTLISVKGKQSNVRITWTVTSLGGN